MKREDYDEIITRLREARGALPVVLDGSLTAAHRSISRAIGKLEAQRDIEAISAQKNPC